MRKSPRTPAVRPAGASAPTATPDMAGSPEWDKSATAPSAGRTARRPAACSGWPRSTADQSIASPACIREIRSSTRRPNEASTAASADADCARRDIALNSDGPSLEETPQPDEGAGLAGADGPHGHPQNGGDVRRRQLFQEPEHENLTVRVRQGGQRPP